MSKQHPWFHRILSLFLALLLCTKLGAAPIQKAYAAFVLDDILALSIVGSLLAAVGVTFVTSEDMRAGAELAYQQGSADFRKLVNEFQTKGLELGAAIAVAPAVLASVVAPMVRKLFPATQTSVPNTMALGKLPMDGSVLFQTATVPFVSDSDIHNRFLPERYLTLVFQTPLGPACFSVTAYTGGSSGFYLDCQSSVAQSVRYKVSNDYSVWIPAPVFSNLVVTSPNSVQPLRFDYDVTFNDKYKGIMTKHYSVPFSSATVQKMIGDVSIIEFAGTFTGMFPATVDLYPPIDRPLIDYDADKSILADGLLEAAIQEYLRTHTDGKEISINTFPDPDDYVDANWRDVILDIDWKRAVNDAFEGGGGSFGGGGATRPFPEIDDVDDNSSSSSDAGDGDDSSSSSSDAGDGDDSSSEADKPSDGTEEKPWELDVPELSLPAAIISVFPFSIPWDIARGVELLSASPVTPRWEIPFRIPGICDESIVLDFAPFDGIAKICRWCELFLFVLGLALLTRKVIKW